MELWVKWLALVNQLEGAHEGFCYYYKDKRTLLDKMSELLIGLNPVNALLSECMEQFWDVVKDDQAQIH